MTAKLLYLIFYNLDRLTGTNFDQICKNVSILGLGIVYRRYLGPSVSRPNVTC